MYAYTNFKNHIILKININLPSAYPRVVLVGYTQIIIIIVVNINIRSYGSPKILLYICSLFVTVIRVRPPGPNIIE